MTDSVITARGVGKRYLIGHQSAPIANESFVASSARALKNAWSRTSDLLRGQPIVMGDSVEEFWALNDVSFDIRAGEAVGLIGRNGAGKSTLLKVLSRITEPTTGRIVLKGRVASLLEGGTGFDGAVSGRDIGYV